MRSRVRWVLLVVAALAAGCARDAKPVSADVPSEPLRVVEEHWPNGQLKSRMQVSQAADGTFVNDGTFTAWHDNGEKSYEATYVRGTLHGVETAWHKNGRRWTETHYVNGVKHGPRYSWYESGQMSKEEHWHNGEPAGAWTVWKTDGQIKLHQTYGEQDPQP